MFDSNLCDRTLHNMPAYQAWWSMQWLNKPVLLVILLLLAFFGIRWIVQNPRRRRWLKRPKTLLLLFSVTALFPLLLVAANQALVAFVPPDPGTPADAIVILGRGSPLIHQRVNSAAKLWQAGRAPRIFTSGIGDAKPLITLLEAQGIPQRVLDGENCSLTTEENAIFTAAILQPQGIRRILLVTDTAHMLRSFLLFRAYGFTVMPHISPVPDFWNPKQKAILKIREYGGIINAGLRGRFFKRSLSDLNSPELKTLIQEAEKYGQESKKTNMKNQIL